MKEHEIFDGVQEATGTARLADSPRRLAEAWKSAWASTMFGKNQANVRYSPWKDRPSMSRQFMSCCKNDFY